MNGKALAALFTILIISHSLTFSRLLRRRHVIFYAIKWHAEHGAIFCNAQWLIIRLAHTPIIGHSKALLHLIIERPCSLNMTTLYVIRTYVQICMFSSSINQTRTNNYIHFSQLLVYHVKLNVLIKVLCNFQLHIIIIMKEKEVLCLKQLCCKKPM